MRPLSILLLVLLVTGCDIFLPQEKHAVRKCGDPTPIYADDGSGKILAWAQLCVTVYEVPTPYGDSVDLEEPAVVDTVYTAVR